FSACSLAGTASCQLLLRPGRTALFCFPCAALRISGFFPKRSALPNSIFSGSSRKCRAWPGEQVPPASECPQESRTEKGDSNHVPEPHFPYRLRRQRRTTEIHKERHP